MVRQKLVESIEETLSYQPARGIAVIKVRNRTHASTLSAFKAIKGSAFLEFFRN